MLSTTLGPQVVAEWQHFRDMLLAVPKAPGGLRSIDTDHGRLVGDIDDVPTHPGSIVLALKHIDQRDIMVSYDLETVAQTEGKPLPDEQVVKRSLFYWDTRPDDSQIDTHIRDTVAETSDSRLIVDRTHHATAVYPGLGKKELSGWVAHYYSGVLVQDAPEAPLPLTPDQQAALAGWNIAL